MSLSVEDLWKVQYSLEEWAHGLLQADEAIIGEDGVEQSLLRRNELIDAITAIRELIAIKEAEPVATLRNDPSQYSFTVNPEQLVDGEVVIQLIRKPE